MASVRITIFLYSACILSASGLWSGGDHDSYGGRHHRRPGVRRRVVVVRERVVPEHHVHVTHEVRHVPAVLDTCHGCHQGYEGSVSVVRDHYRDHRPDVVVVDHGGADYLPAPRPRVAVAVEPRPVVAVVEAAPTTAVVPETYGGSRIDPR